VAEQPPVSRQGLTLAALVLCGVISTTACADPDSIITCPDSGISVYVNPEEGSYRCDLAWQFTNPNVGISAEASRGISLELSRPYATKLELTGTAQLPLAAVQVLLDELPDAARLINHYEDTRYEIRYLDDAGKRFFATNNRNMSAEFTRFDVLRSHARSRHLMFERGKAKFLLWRFKGSSIIDLGLVESGDETEFVARLHVFTDSKRYHSFFRSGLFRYFVKSVVLRIIDDLSDAANRLIKSERAVPSLTPTFADKLRASSKQ